MRSDPFILVLIPLILMKAGFCVAAEEVLKGLRLGGREARWEITARKLSYLEEEGLYVAEGDVVIERDGQVLSAQRATYHEKTGIAKVSGDVRLEIEGDVLTGESGTFNLKTYVGEIKKGRLFDREHHFYISGDLVEKVGPNRYKMTHARLTTCDGVRPDWSITGSEVDVTVEGYGTVKDATFRVLDFPVVYVPYAIFPVKTKRQTGLLPPRLGYSNRNGADGEIPFFWAITEQADATFYERYMGERGFMQGLEFRYVAQGDSGGVFLFDILSDRMEKKDLNNPEDVELSPFPRTNETRYWLRSRTDQQLPWDVLARFDTDYLSDQDYLREFTGGLFGYEARPDLVAESGRPMEEIQSPTRRSTLRLSRNGEDYVLQGGGTYFQRPENPPNDGTPQPLGALDFTLLPRALPRLPLFFKFNTNYGYIWREEGIKGQSLALSPELSYPLWFGRYLQLEPSVSYLLDAQWFDDLTQGLDHQSKDVYKVQTRLSSLLERVFDFQWRDATKLKHKILPSLTHTYRIPRDEDKPRPWFESMDTEGKINQLALSVENLFDARLENKKGEVRYAQWGTLALTQAYDIDEERREESPERGKRPFLPLVAEMSLTPSPDLHLDAEAQWDHEEDEILSADVSLELSVGRSGGRRDRFEIDYEFVRGESESISYTIDLNLMYGFSAGTTLKRDIPLRENISSSYWLEYRSQCWAVRLTAQSIDAVDSVMVTFHLLGLGALGGS